MIKKVLLSLGMIWLSLQAEAQSVIASQNFSTGLGNWTSTDVNGSGTKWLRKTGAVSTPSYGNFNFKSPGVSNGYVLAVADNDPPAPINTELTSPAINCSSHSYVGLSFYQWLLMQYTNTVATVSVSTDNAYWTEIYNAQFNYQGANPELIELDISAYAAYQPTVYIKFKYSNTLSEIFWAVDEIQVMSLPEYDIAVKSVNTPKYTGLLNQPITVTVQNKGGKNINDLTLGYEVNGVVETQYFNNLGILPFMSQDFTFTKKAALTEVGTYNFKALSYGISAGLDYNTANDTAQSSIITLSHLPKKNILLEEFTTAPCGWCPGGTTRINKIMETESDHVIPLGLHAGFGTDAMTIPGHSTLSSSFGSGAPSAAIDRVLFEDQDEINVGLPSLASSYNSWKVKVLERKDYLQPVSIIASNTFTANTRQLSVNVNATFHGTVKGDFRINCYIVEDSVTGTGSGYNQVNYYAASPTDTNINPWYKKGNPIVGFAHRHVVRHFLGGTWGTAGIIPSTTVPDVMYSQNYNFTIPSGWNIGRLHLVPFISEYNSNFLSGKNQVLNSARMDLNGQVSIDAPEAVYISGIDEISSLNGVSVFPNPANESVTVSYQLESETKLSYDLYNMMGQLVTSVSESQVPKGTINTTLNTENLGSGIYLVSIKEAGVSVHTAKFIIER